MKTVQKSVFKIIVLKNSENSLEKYAKDYCFIRMCVRSANLSLSSQVALTDYLSFKCVRVLLTQY
jgi:hypothetical protein